MQEFPNNADQMIADAHDISDLKETQSALNYLVDKIPGGTASYRIVGNHFIPLFYSDGVTALFGYTRQEYMELTRSHVLGPVYEQDQERVERALQTAVESGDVINISYRMRHKSGNLIWVHLNGCRMGSAPEHMKFYAVFTGMTEESRLFQAIANGSADGIYVIDKRNYDLLYISEARGFLASGRNCIDKKCYQALQGKDHPCEFCTLLNQDLDGKEHEMAVESTGRFYSTRFKETEWNGIPAYIKYIRDITEDVKTRLEKERLEQYFQTVLKYLPGGIAVMRYENIDSIQPEFLSEGFAALTGMTLEEAWTLYREDAMAGVHPEDRSYVNDQMTAYVSGGEKHCEIVYRLQKGGSGYVWVKNSLSMIENERGEKRIYSVYHDMTKERAEKERIRLQYNELIMQHYRPQDPNVLIMGHCNITKNRILEIEDRTNSDLLKTFGIVREEFFTGIGSLIVDEREKNLFYGKYLNAPSLDAFERGDTEQKMECFVKFPRESRGRYIQILMLLVTTPDSGDVTGILTITDITEKVITDRILQGLFATAYDFVIDLDLSQNSFTTLSISGKANCLPDSRGCHTKRVEQMAASSVIPRDRNRYKSKLDPAYIERRLREEGSYSFSFSVSDVNGKISTKSLNVSAVDLRLGRVCISRTDITDSVREQQGLLRLIAYTFELAGFINLESESLTLYTRETVLENLPPHYVENYNTAIVNFVDYYSTKEERLEARRLFQSTTMIETLKEKPNGYEFLFAFHTEAGERYKQINVMWGDVNHRTICLVRADVTDTLAAERYTKKALEDALSLAEEANRAKSDFLSAMSHDIRTPMNAIMGMTTLASANLGNTEKVGDCLEKIASSSKHLLSLINDILDMSKIERSQITLNRMKISLDELLGQLNAIMAPQARAKGLQFTAGTSRIRHAYFYGDELRINQIFINILSNAVKYTPEGGSIAFLVEEIPPVSAFEKVRYRFTVTDTGIGMTEEFLAHIFDPFTRNNGTERIEGTGLGLSITKGLVDLMGGKISVNSRPGHGSCFCVELECEVARQMPKETAVPSTFGFRESADKNLFDGYLFLVVEDNPINAEILCELLAMYGAAAVLKTDGLQAVREFQEKIPDTYDAILMDVQMPQMNGYEATRAIRSLDRPDARRIPIIAMTANAFSEDVEASRAAGMTAHIAKPIDVSVLKRTLEKVLKHS